MEKKELYSLLINPLEKGIWSLEVKLPINGLALKEFLKNERGGFFAAEDTLGILLKLLEVTSTQEEKGYKDVIKKLDRLRIKKKDDKRFRHYLSHAADDIKLEEYKEYLKALNPLKEFIALDQGESYREIVFFNPETCESFRIEDIRNTIFSNKITISSYSLEPLKTLKTFFGMTSKETIISIKKKYSPDKLVFSSYMFLFYHLKKHKEFIENAKIREGLYSALEEFDRNKMEGAIRAAGIMMEEVLTEIYETCIRERLPQNATLGNMMEKLNSDINKIFGNVDKKDEIALLLKNLDKVTEKKGEEDPSLKDIIVQNIRLSQRTNQDLKQLIHSLKIKSTKNSLFPEKVFEYLYSAVEFRNLSSHKRDRDLGEFETSLTLRGAFCLLFWWEYIKRKVPDWDKNKIDLIKEIIKESSDYPNIDKISAIF